MTGNNQDDAALDKLLNDAAATRAQPSPDFIARLVADAEAHVPQKAAPIRTAPRRTSWLAGIFTASGLSGAAIAGVWIGFAMPDTLDSFDFTADTSVALTTFLPGADLGAVFDE